MWLRSRPAARLCRSGSLRVVLLRRVVVPLGAFAALSAGAPGQQPPAAVPTGPVIVFESPKQDDYASGPLPIRIRVEPKSADVRSVTLFADGQQVCTLQRPPFECTWNAGPHVSVHTLRASAQLAGGQVIRHSILTRGEAYTETVDVDAVQVTATVTDGDGRFVRGLDSDAFRLFEDNVQQNLTSFQAKNVPLEIVVAVDVSGSMTPAMPTVKAAVKKFLSALASRPADRVTVLGFNDSPFTLSRPTDDLATRLKAVDRLAPWGGTALYDVVIDAVGKLGRQPGSRAALVLFTDGEDRDSHTPLEAAQRRIEASEVTLYPIGQGRAQRVLALRTVLEQLAKTSGGRPFFKNLDKLDEVFSAILEELSNQYFLGFVPKNSARDGLWRALRVEVPGRDVKIRTRQGYRLMPK